MEAARISAAGERPHRRVATPLRPETRPLVALQRTAGNRAVTSLVERTRGRAGAVPAGRVAQRHSSFEHALLGDTPPSQIGKAAVSETNAGHVLSQQWRQMQFFARDPGGDPTSEFPGIRWIKLRGSSLWVSYGELNALADYLPDAEHIDTLPRSVVVPVLQRMRSQVTGALHPVMRLRMQGQAEAGGYEFLTDAVAEAKAMDGATAGLEANRYTGLVARNACHFAPFSWHRWARFHNTATEHAQDYHARKGTRTPLQDLDTSAPEALRQAWLNNGYGDHFLQDSFAAGHLINKTLVMQWFVDYVNGLASQWWDVLGPIVLWGFDNTRPWYGMPGPDVMETMGSAEQPGIAGRHLYGRPPGRRTTEEDRHLGGGPTDPQSAQERYTREQRVRGSGVRAGAGRTREQAYRAYTGFLNSAFLQLAAGEAHDYFNERGLSVGNERGDTLQVGGDETLLSKSGQVGAEVAAEAAQMSRDAIDETVRTGTTAHTVESIWRLVPTSIWHHTEKGGWQQHPLEQWQDEVLHQICIDEIFPDVVDSASSKIARGASPELSASGVELDPSLPEPVLPPLDELGDFPVPGRGPAGIGTGGGSATVAV